MLAQLIVSVSFAQPPKDVQEILMSKSWRILNGDYKEILPQSRIVFTPDSITIFDGLSDSRLSRPYYLCDKKEKSFDEEKIGKARNGRYIIEPGRKVSASEIISVSENEVKIINDSNKIRIFVSISE